VLLTHFAMVSPALADEQPVLIVYCTSNIEQVDSLGARKISLGLTMTHSGARLWPVLNAADVRAKKVFLQDAVSISDITDDRRLLRLAPQPGQTQLVAHKNIASFSKDFPTDPIARGYTRVTNVKNNVDVKILRILWQN
jgi:hypothetical protein